jgi:phosphohistidine phosphatase
VDLFVVRHAIAFERDASRWPDDRDRPLTPQGEAKFLPAARGLGRIAPNVDVVLSSPLIRAWRTAELLVAEAGWPEPLPCEALEPDRSPPDVVESLRPHRGRDAVAIVGHEPLLGDVIAYLLVGSDEHAAFPLRKGGAACVDLDGDPPGGAILRWLVTPKIERKLGT